MAITKKQFWSLLIALIMLSSTIGFLNLSDSNTPQAPIAPDIPLQPPTTITYSASNVDSKVIQLFPTGVLIGTTSEYDIGRVIAALMAVEGVTAVNNAQFLDAQSGGENFRAELRLSSPDNAAEVLEALNNSDSFSNLNLFPQALVSLPETVEFSNPTLDLTISHTFPDPKTQAYITTSTAVDDELVLSLNAVFQGTSIVDLTAFEEQNLTSSPQIYFVNESFTIISLENEFFVRGTSDLSEKEKLENIKSFLEENNDSESSTIEVSQVSNNLTVNFDGNSFFREDLETFLDGFEGVESHSVAPDSSTAIITFSADVDFVPFKINLETELNSLGFEVASIEEPIVSLQGNISAESKEVLLASVETTSIENLVELEVLQKAIINADSIFVPDANASFALNAGSFEAFVKTTRNQGDEVELTLLLNASERLGITDIQAQEVEEN